MLFSYLDLLRQIALNAPLFHEALQNVGALGLHFRLFHVQMILFHYKAQLGFLVPLLLHSVVDILVDFELVAVKRSNVGQAVGPFPLVAIGLQDLSHNFVPSFGWPQLGFLATFDLLS